MQKSAVKDLPAKALARGEFSLPGYEELEKMSLEQKLGAVRQSRSRNAPLEIVEHSERGVRLFGAFRRQDCRHDRRL